MRGSASREDALCCSDAASAALGSSDAMYMETRHPGGAAPLRRHQDSVAHSCMGVDRSCVSGARRSTRRRSWRTALGFACAAAVMPHVAAQVEFTEAPAPDYLTYCLESASGKVMPGACAYASYAQLQGYLVEALTNPYGEDNATMLAGIDSICGAGCDGELLTLGQSYVQLLPPVPANQSSWCDLVAAPNALPLLQNSVPFLCLQNTQNQYCAVEVGKALFDANLLSQLVAILQAGPNEQDLPPQLNLNAVDQHAFCHSLLTTGCCAQTFIDMTQALLLMTCHPKAAQALSALVSGCNTPLQPGCPGMQFQPFTMPTSCPQGGLVLPPVGTKCPIPAGSCPVTSCELLCAIVAGDPPGEDAHVSSDSSDGAARAASLVASDVSSDLGNNAGGGAAANAFTPAGAVQRSTTSNKAAVHSRPSALKMFVEAACAVLLFTLLALGVQLTTRAAHNRRMAATGEEGEKASTQQLLWPPPQPLHV